MSLAAINAIAQSASPLHSGPLTIGIDVGGTKIAAGLVDSRGRVLARRRSDTNPSDGSAMLRTLADLVKGPELTSPGPVAAVGVAAPGLVDGPTVVFAPNIPAWRNAAVGDELSDLVGLPVILENDANAAGWGEARHGAGIGHANQICVTVGTGIGGAFVVDGGLVRGGWGFGGEVGHLVLDPDGPPCPCGLRGCWETYASGTALVRDARRRAALADDDATSLLALGDGTPDGLTGQHIKEAAAHGNPIALAAYEACGASLGRGLAILITLLDPTIVVISGGVADAGDLLLNPARRVMIETTFAQSRRPGVLIVGAALGPDAGVVGVADQARRAACLSS